MSERCRTRLTTLVIGGGVAGLTAALFAMRSGYSTLVLVPGIPGGQPSPAKRATETSSEDAHAQGETPRMSWARLLKRVFDIDLEHCPNCGGALKIIAAIEDPPVIVKILTHLGLPTRAPRRVESTYSRQSDSRKLLANEADDAVRSHLDRVAR